MVARSHGLRILPIILRPCSIPANLSDTVGIDATAGLHDEVVRLRLVRSLSGTNAPDDTVLLDATRRSLLAAQDLQIRADRALPEVRANLEPVRDLPIRSLSISMEANSFPEAPGAVLELRLTFDTLFSQPMSVYFAKFREGATWPKEFGLAEPSYRQFFRRNVERIQATFRWFDQVLELEQVIDGTDLGDLPATWRLALSGAEFRPAGPGVHLPQRLEIPPLAKLVTPPNGFALILHDPTRKTASAVDVSRADIDVVVAADYADRVPQSVTLFRSRHSGDERAILGAQSFADLASPVEKEAALGVYVRTLPTTQGHAERIERVEQLLETDSARTDEERSLAARLSASRAALAAVRAQHRDALAGYMKAANLLQPAVFDGRGTYAEAVLLYSACASVVEFFLEREDATEAAKYIDAVVAVAGRLREIEPHEPDYRRLWADAMLDAARTNQGTGHAEDAASHLRERVDALRSLAVDLPSADTNEDLHRALAEGLALASTWHLEASLPVDPWRHELDPGKTPEEWGALLDPAHADAWVQPTTLADWPTHAVTSDLLRYGLMVPDRWSDSPALQSTGREVDHIYRGPSPVEWLVVSFMDNADAASNMRNWVDALVTMAGFPILEMQAAFDPHPVLMDWRYEGRDPALAKRLGADEAHRYQGMATLAQPGGSRLARIYIVLARRATLAWKFALSFETATLPGMAPGIVEANDHVRAGATFGSLELR